MDFGSAENRGIFLQVLKGPVTRYFDPQTWTAKIKELKNTAAVSELCHSTTEPIYITKNGYGDMVLMSMEAYEAAFFKLHLYQELERSEQQIQEGKVTDANESLAKLREKYEL